MIFDSIVEMECILRSAIVDGRRDIYVQIEVKR